jgi:hypothetical protein
MPPEKNMGKRKITQEAIAQWVHLHRQGQSYRNIARQFKVDPRTVKSWIEKAGEEAEREHWEAVTRQVDAGYLDNHYRMLLMVARAVLDATETDPITVHHDWSADSWFNEHILYSLEKLPIAFAEVNVESASMTEQSTLSAETARRLSNKLFYSLVEHEPQLGKAVEKWKEAWAGFQKLRLELVDAAENLFKQRKVTEKPAAALGLVVVQEALETGILGQKPCSFQIEERGEGMADLNHGRSGTMKKILQGSRQEIEADRDAYQRLLEQVSHEGRMSPVKDAYRSVRQCMIEVQEIVDRLILIGRPNGQCSLCFNHSIR